MLIKVNVACFQAGVKVQIGIQSDVLFWGWRGWG